MSTNCLESPLVQRFVNEICFVKVADPLTYAYDDTVSHSDKDLKSIYGILTQQSKVAIYWFRLKQMLANNDKFNPIKI